MFYEANEEPTTQTMFALTKDTGAKDVGNVVLAEDFLDPETGSPVWIPVDMAENKNYRVFLFGDDSLNAEDVKEALAGMVRLWGPSSIMNGKPNGKGSVLFFTGVDVVTTPAQREVRW